MRYLAVIVAMTVTVRSTLAPGHYELAHLLSNIEKPPLLISGSMLPFWNPTGVFPRSVTVGPMGPCQVANFKLASDHATVVPASAAGAGEHGLQGQHHRVTQPRRAQRGARASSESCGAWHFDSGSDHHRSDIRVHRRLQTTCVMHLKPSELPTRTFGAGIRCTSLKTECPSQPSQVGDYLPASSKVLTPPRPEQPSRCTRPLAEC